MFLLKCCSAESCNFKFKEKLLQMFHKVNPFQAQYTSVSHLDETTCTYLVIEDVELHVLYSTYLVIEIVELHVRTWS